jgi:hypothetical protein
MSRSWNEIGFFHLSNMHIGFFHIRIFQYILALLFSPDNIALSAYLSIHLLMDILGASFFFLLQYWGLIGSHELFPPLASNHNLCH